VKIEQEVEIIEKQAEEISEEQADEICEDQEGLRAEERIEDVIVEE